MQVAWLYYLGADLIALRDLRRKDCARRFGMAHEEHCAFHFPAALGFQYGLGM